MSLLHIKSRIVRSIGAIGGFRASRWLTRETPKVLMYHRFSEKPTPGRVHKSEFSRQIDYLARHFNVMRMDQLFKCMATNPAELINVAVITVDDGYLDFYENAFPLLREAGIPATLFLTTHFADGDFWLWPDRVRYILEQSDYIETCEIPGFKQCNCYLDDNMREKLWERIVAYLLSIEESRKQLWIEEFTERQGVNVPRVPTTQYSAVTWEQVREMAAANIEIGAHTRTHPSLGMISTSRLQYEITGAVSDIKWQTGWHPVSFCFPNGQRDDYTDTVKEYVKQAGCMGAVTAFYDKCVTDDLYEIRRFPVSENRFQFEKSVNGVELLAARWLNSSNRTPRGVW